MPSNNIMFKVSMFSYDNSFDLIKELIDILSIKPKQMNPASAHKTIRFNAEQFYNELSDALNKKDRFSTSVSQGLNNSFTLRYDDISNVITIIVFLEKYNNEIKNMDKLINSGNIITAFFRNEEDGLLSKAFQISSYERRGIDTSNLKKKIWSPFNEEIIDIEQFSGHSHEYGGIEFTSTYLMWFGKDFFRFVPQETLTSFKDCVSNETFDNGTVRIQLYEDINDYNTEETDRRQWAFRKHTNIDKVAEEWNKEYLAMASKDKSGANMTIENGHFEHGGVKLVKLYLDKDNNTTTKKHAVKVKCVEYDSAGNVVFDNILSV